MPWQNIASIPGYLLEKELSRKEGGSSQPSINWPGIARDQLSGRNYVIDVFWQKPAENLLDLALPVFHRISSSA